MTRDLRSSSAVHSAEGLAASRTPVSVSTAAQILRMMGTVVLQQTAIGYLTVALMQRRFVPAFVAAIVINGAWWVNAGHRIDLHRNWAAGVIYALTAAASVVAGAYLGWH